MKTEYKTRYKTKTGVGLLLLQVQLLKQKVNEIKQKTINNITKRIWEAPVVKVGLFRSIS